MSRDKKRWIDIYQQSHIQCYSLAFFFLFFAITSSIQELPTKNNDYVKNPQGEKLWKRQVHKF